MHSLRMDRRRLTGLIAVALGCAALPALRGWSQGVESIELKTKEGPLVLQPLKHGSVLATFKGKNYYIDPAQLPAGAKYAKADAIFITHEHGDHLDPKSIDMVKSPATVIVTNARCAEKLGTGIVMKNGDSRKVVDVQVEAVPAYNIERAQFHPKGRDNGFVMTFADKRVYFAADTEPTPEMKALKNIDVAFLPINLPYTMPPKDAAEAARAFKPKLLVPYHQGQSNPQEVADALKGSGVEVKVLRLP